jgi:hypothetical protein
VSAMPITAIAAPTPELRTRKSMPCSQCGATAGATLMQFRTAAATSASVAVDPSVSYPALLG